MTEIKKEKNQLKQVPEGWRWTHRKISIQDNPETGVKNERTILGVFKNLNYDPEEKGSQPIKFFVLEREGGSGGITREDQNDLVRMLEGVLEDE